jgi:hypothetical protein
MQAVSIRRKSYVSSFEIGDPAALNNQTKHPYGSQRPSLKIIFQKRPEDAIVIGRAVYTQ